MLSATGTPADDSSAQQLQALRDEIERIDRELLVLLRQRMQRVERVAQTKLAAASPFRDHQREEQVLQRVRGAAVELGLDAHAVERLYRRIMEMSISHQQAHVRGLETAPLRVAYQGVEGSYSHLAARRRYAGRKGGTLLTGHETVADAAASVRDGSADVALLPIENSSAGSINETYDILAGGGLTINAEVVRRVRHCLLALPGATVEDLRLVLSHPQALRQCESFLQRAPWIRQQAEFDTAGAARKVRESGDRTMAAIASRSAAEITGLEILAAGIETQTGNATRFVEVAIEAAPCPADEPCKTSLLMVLEHSAGALGEVLTRFGHRGIQLAKIESRPIATDAWAYRFYLDVDAHADNAEMVAALAEVGPMTSELRVLGSYPRATPEQIPD